MDELQRQAKEINDAREKQIQEEMVQYLSGTRRFLMINGGDWAVTNPPPCSSLDDETPDEPIIR